jgi:hypothetical protein
VKSPVFRDPTPVEASQIDLLIVAFDARDQVRVTDLELYAALLEVVGAALTVALLEVRGSTLVQRQRLVGVGPWASLARSAGAWFRAVVAHRFCHVGVVFPDLLTGCLC